MIYRTFRLSEINQVRQCLQTVGLYGQLGLDSLYFGKWKKISKARHDHELD